MKTRVAIPWVYASLVLVVYSAYLALRVGHLEGRLERLEASNAAVGRYVYDFGTVLTTPSNDSGPSPVGGAQAVLVQMRHDELTRAAVFSPRAKHFLIESTHSSRNSASSAIQ